ncbi:hypothetical protein GGX14DRAFT_344474 [Mycena pura]|uniref:Uncharacterized protein n=1 Tax=Mycena pura TaxID=153505 RepID=A0AAD7E5F9_9AGAR|nr:hypothetical protein GGX14DRAFT_344474 [Mycena pura]
MAALFDAEDSDSLRATREKLYSDIEKLRTRFIQRVPKLEERMREIDPDKPEESPMLLPSEFNVVERRTFTLEALAQLEQEQREHQALGALEELRTAIRTFNWNMKPKQADIHGIHGNTRAAKFLKSLSNVIQAAGDKYRRIRNALIALGMPENHATFQPLHRTQQHGKVGRGIRMGDSRQREPWFWATPRPAGLSEADKASWDREMDRVQWFRERALMHRAQEEIEILTVEFQRATEFFKHSAAIWSEIATGSINVEASARILGHLTRATLGWRAYAYHQAGIYSDLQSGCQRAWEDLPNLIAVDQEKEDKKAQEKAVKAGAESLRTDYSVSSRFYLFLHTA